MDTIGTDVGSGLGTTVGLGTDGFGTALDTVVIGASVDGDGVAAFDKTLSVGTISCSFSVFIGFDVGTAAGFGTVGTDGFDTVGADSFDTVGTA